MLSFKQNKNFLIVLALVILYLSDLSIQISVKFNENDQMEQVRHRRNPSNKLPTGWMHRLAHIIYKAREHEAKEFSGDSYRSVNDPKGFGK